MVQGTSRRQLCQVYQHVLRRLSTDFPLRARLQSQRAPFTQLLAIGKAAPRMAEVAAPYLGPVREGFVLTKEAHLSSSHQHLLWGFETWEAGHPIPDAKGQLATERLLEWVDEVRRPDHLLMLVSGGASSLVVDPAPPLSLQDLRTLQTALLASGMPIEEINVVRKHTSVLKGGGLGQRLARFDRVTQLIYSDICPDVERLDLVGSGLALADPSTLEQASEFLARLEPALGKELGGRCRRALRETLKELPWSAECLADYRTLTQLALELLGPPSSQVPCWADTVTGNVSELAKAWASLSTTLWRQGFRGVLVAAGEPTVRLCDPLPAARGGRCQELAARFAKAVSGHPGVALLAGSSDGTDGPTPYAGACVDGSTWELLRRAHGEATALEKLEGHDATGLLGALEGVLLDTGPTGHNLTDLFLLSVADS